MEFDKLEKLSNLELRKCVRDVNGVSKEDIDLYVELYNKLLKSPVEVNITAQRGLCEDHLYELCLSLQGRYKEFVYSRYKLGELYREFMFKKLSENNNPGPCLVSVLFNGIYIGHYKDLLNYRKGNSEKLLYSTKGLGEKIAEVIFLDGNRKVKI